VSKLDKVIIVLGSATNMNPLSEVNLTIDYKLIKRDPKMVVEEDGMLLKLEEDMIAQHVINIFKNRFINNREKFAMPIYDGKCILICHVEKITPVDIKSSQSYGIIPSSMDVEICCKP
jgi:hypothetical protein